MFIRQRADATAIYVAVVALAAVACALAAALADPALQLNPLLVVAFAAGFVVVHLLPLPILHQRDVELIRMDEAVLISLLLAARPLEGLAAVVLGVLAGQVLSRNGPGKTIFNTGQMVVAASAGFAVTTLLVGTTPGLTATGVAAAVFGAAICYLVSSVLVAGVVCITTGQRMGEVLLSDFAFRARMFATTASIGVLVAAAAYAWPALVLVAILPLLLLRTSYQAFLDRAASYGRIAGLSGHAQALGGELSMRDCALDLVGRARAMAGAGSAELRIAGDRNVYVSDAYGEREVDRDKVSARARRTTDIVAQVSGRSGLSGTLTVRGDRSPLSSSGFTSVERSIVEALVHQAQIGLDNAWLFQQVIAERRKMARVFEHSSEGLLVINGRGRIVSWNPAMTSISGYTHEEMVDSHAGLVAPDFAAIPGDDRGGVVAAELRTKDGETRIVHAHFSHVEDGGGEASADEEEDLWVLVVHDVTRQVEIERLKDDFVSTVSHELRTPLTSIKGFIETMRRTDVATADNVPLFLDIMSEQADRLERLITDLLEVSAIESGRPLKLEIAPVRLHQLAHRTVQAFMAAHSDCDVQIESEQDAAVALGDPHRIEQMLNNLLQNARRHAGEHPRIRVAWGEDANTQRAWLRVVDDGPGVPREDRERIFDRFYSGASGLARTGGGAGLGLYISKRLADAMHGTIRVDEAEGGGASFVIDLPSVRIESLPTGGERIIDEIERGA